MLRLCDKGNSVKVLQMQVLEGKAKPVGWASLLLRTSEIPSGCAVTAVQLIQDMRGLNYLGNSGWQPERTWIKAQGSDDGAGQTAVDLGPEVTRHINANSNVEICASVDGVNAFGSRHLIWPAIQQKARSSRRSRRPVVGGGRKVEPEVPATYSPTSNPAPTFEAPKTASQPSPTEEQPTSSNPSADLNKTGLKIGAAIASVLIVAGALVFVFFDKLPFGNRGEGEQPVTAAQDTEKVLSMMDVRKLIKSDRTSPEDLVAQAELQMEVGNLGAALLLYKSATEAGSAAGAIGFAKMYDPGLHVPTTSPLNPNAGRAVSLYEKAANLGEAFAMRRLGILLYEGGSGISADQIAGKNWLKKAAAAGDEEAETYLQKI